MISANKKAVLNFTRHVMRAGLNVAPEAEESKPPEFLIKRTFPSFPQVKIPQFHVTVPKAQEQRAQAQQQFAIQNIPKPREKVIKQIQEPVEIFELGKITKFAMDKMIGMIECPGPDVPLRIKKENHLFSTDIKLSESEIKEIIDLFSKEARTPISPVFTASAREFSMTAILSDYGSRFVIKRI